MFVFSVDLRNVLSDAFSVNLRNVLLASLACCFPYIEGTKVYLVVGKVLHGLGFPFFEIRRDLVLILRGNDKNEVA